MKADVLVENFKTGQMRKFGLDYDQLREKNRELVYCSITGYGSTGPYAEDPGYDVIAAAIGGFMSITGPEGGVPCKAGVAVTDLLTGVHAFGGIMVALMHRMISGEGQRVECNLLATQMNALVNVASNYLNAGMLGKPWGTAHESIVPYEAFPTKDNRFYVIGAADNSAFAELCSLMDIPEVAVDPDFESNAKRVENRTKLRKILADRFLSQDLDYWRKKLRNRKFPSGPVNNIAEAFAHEQVEHLGLVRELNHPAYGKVKTVGRSIKYSTLYNDAYLPPPLLGEHTREVLKEELDLAEAEMTKFEKNGTIECC